VATSPSGSPSVTERRRRLGQRGENAAAAWYVAAGYDIVDRNWRCVDGELDLVAVRPGEAIVVFCEVKTRSSTAFGRPEEAVTVAKQRRIRRLASRWLSEQRRQRSPLRSVRFDVAAVWDDPSAGLLVEVVHDAF